MKSKNNLSSFSDKHWFPQVFISVLPDIYTVNERQFPVPSRRHDNSYSSHQFMAHYARMSLFAVKWS